jgi:hypothetical protein
MGLQAGDAAAALADPLAQVGDRIGADAKFDEMQGHARAYRARTSATNARWICVMALLFRAMRGHGGIVYIPQLAFRMARAI